MESADRKERIGPGGDPVVPRPDHEEPAEGQRVVLDCGWGRLVFGQTFEHPSEAADVLRAEVAGSRDICIYLEDPHVLVSRRPDELFIDPSLTFRLDLPLDDEPDDQRPDHRRPDHRRPDHRRPDDRRPDRRRPADVPGLRIRSLSDGDDPADDAAVVNGIYARNGMVTAPVDVLVDNAATPEFVHLVAELASSEPDGQALVGTITGVDHVAVFDDPDNGSSLWCLTVDPNLAPPGTGQALLVELARRLAARGREFVDLSVLADNAGAIRLYERLGFYRTPTLCLKRKNPINERLFVASLPDGYDRLNPYAKIIGDEAMRRGIRIEVLDPDIGELRLTHAGRSIVTIESLSELTTAVAMSRCDDKRVTRRILAGAGLRVPRGRDAADDDDDVRFLTEVGTVVVKPARGEQGQGITVGVQTREELTGAIAEARKVHGTVLLEEMVSGDDLRVIVIDNEVVAAAIRRPAAVTGDGVHDVAELIVRQSRRREAATGGESSIPVDDLTREVVRAAGHEFDDVLPEGQVLIVRRTANLHTGGTIHDVTAQLHPALADACVRASEALAIPLTGLDLMVTAPDKPDYVFIEANERPGLANHEPQPTAERFVDLLFPGTSAPPKLWTPGGPHAST